MGILRTDRVSGLGGANAITGSTSFGGGGNHLKVEGIDDDFVTWWTADFTIEAWVFIDNFASWMYDDGNHFPAMVGHMNPTDSSNYWSFGPAESPAGNSTLKFYYWKGSQNHTFVHTATIKENEWTHIAMSFSTSNGAKLFINGTGTSYISLSGTPQVSSSAAQFVVGQYNNQNISGNISNLRILKGTALYTSDFTPPTNRLEKTSDTKLLICNSASDVTHNDDEKIITSVRSSTNNSGPVASRFTPNSPVGFSTTTDVGSQYGTTFDGFTVFATSTYMVPPGGNTRERNRGLALFGGGETPSKVNSIEFVNVQSMGIAEDFGDFTSTSGDVKALGSSTRGVFRTNYDPSSRNTLEFTTFAAASNSIDFGDLVISVGQRPGASNQTRGIFSGGLFPGSTTHNEMDLITIATAGNATDFGNLSVSRADTSALASSTRMIVGGGYTPSTNYGNVMDFVTIATTGNASDFGDLNTGKRAGTAVASSTRGIFGPGKAPSVSDVIDFVTIATTGNATDFGDALVARGGASAASNSIRGLFAGGYSPSLINGIEFITIATTGNGADFGDMTFVSQYGGGCSDSHGGL